jgi:hypothetical protein
MADRMEGVVMSGGVPQIDVSKYPVPVETIYVSIYTLLHLDLQLQTSACTQALALQKCPRLAA